MEAKNFYYNKETSFLAILDENFNPVIGYSGNIAKRKYAELSSKKPSITDLKAELELCKSVLLKSPELEPEIRMTYQRKYRKLKKAIEKAENELLTKNI